MPYCSLSDSRKNRRENGKKNTESIGVDWLVLYCRPFSRGGRLWGNYTAKANRVDTEYVKALITKSSELTTAKYNYTGMTEYTDSGVPVVNRSDFIMVYKATARTGIDVSQVKVRVDDSKKIVYLTLPHATVQDVNVDTSSIKYFDEGFAVVNGDSKEDNNKAIDMAKKDAKEEIKTSGVLETADTQAETLIKGILQSAVPSDYTYKVTRTS